MLSLADQLKAQWNGDWNAGGVDRAGELARLLSAQGINNLSDIKWGTGTYKETMPAQWNIDTNSFEAPVSTEAPGINLNGMGWFGTINNDGSISGGGASPYSVDNSSVPQQFGTNGYKLGGSVAGHGNVSYMAVPDGKGGYQFMPQWGSSSDMDVVREFGKAALGAATLGYGIPALAGAAGGAGAGAGAAAAGAGAAETGASLATLGEIGSAVTPMAIESGASIAGLSEMAPSLLASLGTVPAELAGAGAVGTGLAGSAAAGAGLSSSAPGAATTFAPSMNYGAGMLGLQTSAYDSVLSATGSKAAADTVANSALGSSIFNSPVTKGLADMFSGLGSNTGWLDLLKGGMSLYQASQMGKLGTPSQSAQTAEQQLSTLLRDPSSLTSLPGYQAGLQAVMRTGAGNGYLGSGNMMIGLSQYAGDFYNNTLKQLSSIANEGKAIDQQYNFASTSLTGHAINNFGYALTKLFGD